LALTLVTAFVLVLVSVGAVGSDVWAHPAKKRHFVGDAPGSVTCTLAGSVQFSPRLSNAGGATNPSTASGKLSGCTTTDSVVQVSGATFTGSFASSHTPTCATLASLTTPATFTIHWKARVTGAIGANTFTGKATLTTSVMSSTSERISSPGGGDLLVTAPTNPHSASVTGSFAGGAQSSFFVNVTTTSLATLCDSKATGGTGKGIRRLTLNGTVTIGASQAAQLSGASVLATDAQQSFCAVLKTGAIRCWGDNSAGQLGNATTTTASIALPVTGITTAVAIASDGNHSFCALLNGGALECWGANGSGQLGNGTTTGSTVPVRVTGITTATSVTSDGNGTYCAILQSGVIECWGANNVGQLGDNSTTGSSVPVAVTGITNGTALTSDGNGTFCAVLATGVVDCWGGNTFGQLGDNSTAGSSVPVQAQGITQASSITSDTDDSFCAVLSTGLVDCWGANFAGELGNGTAGKSTVPIAVAGITTAVSVSHDGAESYCAVLASGSVNCWGSNVFGELGDGTTTNSSLPVTANAITNAAGISSDGADSFCALLFSGSLNCWGANFAGELGNGTTSSSSVPVAVSGIATATDVAGGVNAAGDTEHAYCAVLTAGGVDCWGSNAFGELGNATTISSAVPVPVLQP